MLTKNTFAFLTLLFFASALLHSFLPFISDFNAFRWFQVSVLIFSCLLFIWGELKLFATFATVAFLLVLSLGAIPYSIVFMFFDLGYWVVVPFVAFYFLIRGVRNFELARWTLVAASIGCILYLPTILMGLGFWYFQGAGRVSDYLPFGFYGIRPWSHLATWLMPLTMGALAVSSGLPLFKHRFWKNLLLITVAFWFAVLLGSGARGSLIAQLLSMLVLFAFFGKKNLVIGKLWMVTFCWGLLVYVLIVVLLPSTIFSATENYSVLRSGTSGRLQLWRYALDLSTRYFPIGAGPLSYTYETSVTGFATPHSLYFRWAAEYGWLFVFVFIGGMLWLGIPSWREFRKAPAKTTDPFFLAIFWSVLAAFIHASVSGVFTSPYSLLVGLPVLVVYFGYVLRERFSHESVSRKLPGAVCIMAVLFGISVAMIPPMHAWFLEARADQNRYIEEYRQPLAPRFWLHGRYTGEKFKDQEVTP